MKSFRKVYDRKIIFIYGLKITYLPQKKAIKAEKKIRSHNFVGQMQWKRKRYKNRDLADGKARPFCCNSLLLAGYISFALHFYQ